MYEKRSKFSLANYSQKKFICPRSLLSYPLTVKSLTSRRPGSWRSRMTSIGAASSARFCQPHLATVSSIKVTSIKLRCTADKRHNVLFLEVARVRFLLCLTIVLFAYYHAIQILFGITLIESNYYVKQQGLWLNNNHLLEYIVV